MYYTGLLHYFTSILSSKFISEIFQDLNILKLNYVAKNQDLSDNFLHSVIHTSKSTSPKQPHVAQGPTIFKISSLFAFWIVNLGRKGSHFCAT